jgi:hypothetical protein
MGVVEWTDMMAATLPFPPHKLIDPEDWRLWARNLIQYPQISAFNPPDPEQFEDWRGWAERFNQTVETL